ncbi:hypothetical protein P8631_11540 (plasmid) [Guyparkeria sp. 1SP6A2]|nr:hypothetical protein [Guyparkeria sp. 1SP6A2]
MNGHGITEREARTLFDVGAIKGVKIEPVPGDGWAVVLMIGMEERPVSSQREQVRTWASLDTAAKWLHRLGVQTATLRLQ